MSRCSKWSTAQTASSRPIARFWDCNPIHVERIGHAMKYSFRMSPSSHWIALIRQERHRIESDYPDSWVYALVSSTMADVFITTWRDKYGFDSERPVTFINERLQPGWMPVIETPSFPEYPSAHSSVSSAAAYLLSRLCRAGEFVDRTQDQFGQEARSYPSFEQAAREAGVSRVYGGIHYQPSVDHGFEQGRKIAADVWERIQASE